MNIPDFKMTQVSEEYKTLSGRITIRKLNDKYIEMMPGDLVEVSHKKDADDVSDLAVEYLTVRSMAVASLRDLVREHEWGLILPYSDRDDNHYTGEIEDYIASFYEYNKSGDFIAIYFN